VTRNWCFVNTTLPITRHLSLSSRMRIAIVGSGISGLYAAWRLGRDHDVTIFEASDYVGGHTNTRDIEWEGKRYAVDTGFIVFNDWSYPNFIAMLRELGVAWQPSNMSFSLRCDRTGLEYSGTSLNSLFAQRRNLLRPSFLRMLTEIVRFNREAKAFAADADASMSLGEYLHAGKYSAEFIERYIVPMGRAIWSAEADAMLACPAGFFIGFFDRHGMLSVDERPQWQAVRGGSREYVRKLLAATRAIVRLKTPVVQVTRMPGQVIVRTRAGDAEHFDAIFFACHSDQALASLHRPTQAERDVLSAFPYAANEAILHTDISLLPRTRLARAAWNYHALATDQQAVALTYDMNVLQTIKAPVRFLVTLNNSQAIDERQIIDRFSYHHPVYLPAGVAAQARHREINGTLGTYYCGAYWRYGFHEDGVVSAMRALEHFDADLRMSQPGPPASLSVARSP
jgi:predicted NAD/FAD-binding protein